LTYKVILFFLFISKHIVMPSGKLTFISLYITVTAFWELHVSLFIIWYY